MAPTMRMPISKASADTPDLGETVGLRDGDAIDERHGLIEHIGEDDRQAIGEKAHARARAGRPERAFSSRNDLARAAKSDPATETIMPSSATLAEWNSKAPPTVSPKASRFLATTKTP